MDLRPPQRRATLPVWPKLSAGQRSSVGNVYSGNYPLSRYLYVYVNKAPNKPLDPLVREFLKFALSKEGQETVIKDGYLPIPAKVAQEETAKIK